MIKISVLSFLILIFSCNQPIKKQEATIENNNLSIALTVQKNPNFKIIHVFVALCDNAHQGIVKVPPKIGNGQDAENNLYWGCDYGIKTFFKKQKNWNFVQTVKNPRDKVLERCVFKYKSENVYLVADAYDGEFIKNCTIDFLQSCAGNFNDFFKENNDTIACGGNSDLLAYIGHDGLMEFSITEILKPKNYYKRETIVLACISKNYFQSYLKQTNAESLIYTTGLMAPEAYTLVAAVEGWINQKSKSEIRELSAQAYNKYQQCGINGARNLFVTE